MADPQVLRDTTGLFELATEANCPWGNVPVV